MYTPEYTPVKETFPSLWKVPDDLTWSVPTPIGNSCPDLLKKFFSSSIEIELTYSTV